MFSLLPDSRGPLPSACTGPGGRGGSYPGDQSDDQPDLTGITDEEIGIALRNQLESSKTVPGTRSRGVPLIAGLPSRSRIRSRRVSSGASSLPTVLEDGKYRQPPVISVDTPTWDPYRTPPSFFGHQRASIQSDQTGFDISVSTRLEELDPDVFFGDEEGLDQLSPIYQREREYSLAMDDRIEADKVVHLKHTRRAILCWEDDYGGLDTDMVPTSDLRDLVDKAKNLKNRGQEALLFFADHPCPEFPETLKNQLNTVKRDLVQFIRQNQAKLVAAGAARQGGGDRARGEGGGGGGGGLG